MIRKIITIDASKCNGCGLCVEACHEGAIGMVDGKATLLREDYCDGLGDCLPACPTGAITFVTREAEAYDEEAVKANLAKQGQPLGCPGSNAQVIHRATKQPAQSFTCPGETASRINQMAKPCHDSPLHQDTQSQLGQWPIQIKLVPLRAPYLQNANLLIAADCTAFSCGDFHQRFMRNKVTLIGCPKLDEGDYSEKLTAILTENDIQSITVVRMEVPCCNGLVNAVKHALQNSKKIIPWQVVTISTDGQILEN